MFHVCRRFQPFFDDVLPITIKWFETRHGHQEKMKKIIEDAAKAREMRRLAKQQQQQQQAAQVQALQNRAAENARRVSH